MAVARIGTVHGNCFTYMHAMYQVCLKATWLASVHTGVYVLYEY